MKQRITPTFEKGRINRAERYVSSVPERRQQTLTKPYVNDDYSRSPSSSTIDDDTDPIDYSSLDNDYSYPDDYSVPEDDSVDSGNKNRNQARGYQQQTSPLQSAEQSTVNNNRSNNSANGTRDISRQERSGYKTGQFSNSANSKTKQGQRFAKFKRGIALGGTLGVLGLGGGFFMQSTIVSGLAQLIQGANVITDFVQGFADHQLSARALRNNFSLSRLVNNKIKGLSDNFQRSRLSTLGNFAADKMVKRMSDNGISFKSGILGSNDGMEINYGKITGASDDANDPNMHKKMEDFAKNMGLNDGDFKIEGLNIIVSDKLDYKQAKKVVYQMNDIGKWNLISKMQARSALKRAGYISAFHPIKKAKAKAIKSLDDFIKESAVLDKFAGKDGKLSKMHKRVTSKADDVLNKAGLNLTTLAKVAGVANFAQAVIQVTCAMHSAIANIGPYKMQNVVNVAEGGSGLIQGYGSQTQSGDDIDLTQAGYAVEETMGADINVTDSQGNDVLDKNGKPKKEYSSFWMADPVCQELGYTCNTSSQKPELLDTVDQGGFTIFGDENSPMNVIFKTLFDNPITQAGCGIYDAANEAWKNSPVGKVVQGVQDWIQSTLIDNLVNLLHVGPALEQFSSFVAQMTTGGPLSLTSLTPLLWGFVGMYGGYWGANSKMITNGGHKLTAKKTSELRRDNREFLAWRESQKPLLARLFDATDYNSVISQVAISAGLHASNQNLKTQLGNVFKLFASAPSLISQSVGKIAGGNAYAATQYNYGPTYAYSVDEINTINNVDNEDYDMFTNADKVMGILQAEDEAGALGSRPYHDYAEQCLAVDISKGDYAVTPKDNEDGTAWNYVDIQNKAICQTDGFLDLRTYVMDYNSVLSSACLEGEEGDSESSKACSDMGMKNEGGGSSSSGDLDISTAGNKDNKQVMEQFMKETNGSYESYSICSNGCTTIPAWYIGAHTTLKYGDGNGNQVVNQLVGANPGKNLQVTNSPTKAPAIFSSNCGNFNSTDCTYGHTGLVTAIDPDGTVHTIEAGTGMSGCHQTYDHPKSDWEGKGVQFVYVGDYLK